MKKIIVLTLCFLLILSGCGEYPSSGEPSSSSWNSIVENIPDGNFVKSDSESYTLEQDGFSVEFTVEKWNPTRGAGEYVRHPADTQAIMPKHNPTDCIIPFVITTTTISKDTSFTTDYHYSINGEGNIVDGVEYRNPRNTQAYLFDIDNFGDNIETLLLNIDPSSEKEPDIQRVVYNAWLQGSGERYIETNLNDTFSSIGYYVIKDYYSPDFPDGNIDLLSEYGATMIVYTAIDNANSNNSEGFIFTMLEK